MEQIRSPYHAGELAVQKRSGGERTAEALGRTIADHMPAEVQEFLQQLPFLVLGAEDERGAVWATYLVADPGFVRPTGYRALVIDGGVLPEDPLTETLRKLDWPVGIIGIEPGSRRRVRLNGRIKGVDGEALTISTEEVYANCPKHIQARRFAPSSSREPGEVRRSNQLDNCQGSWIESADTFFISTLHTEKGADCSHRGGMPGFVRAHDDHLLSFPDYGGNSMYQTLGNLEVDSRAGLVFADYESGTLLHLTGNARADWDELRRSEFDGAQRVVDFEIEGVIERQGALPLTDTFVDYSRYNPGASGDIGERQGDTRPWRRSVGGCTALPNLVER